MTICCALSRRPLSDRLRHAAITAISISASPPAFLCQCGTHTEKLLHADASVERSPSSSRQFSTSTWRTRACKENRCQANACINKDKCNHALFASGFLVRQASVLMCNVTCCVPVGLLAHMWPSNGTRLHHAGASVERSSSSSRQFCTSTWRTRARTEKRCLANACMNQGTRISVIMSYLPLGSWYVRQVS